MHLSEKESVQNHHNVSAKSYFCFTTSVQKQEEMMAHKEVKRLILTKEGRLHKNHFCRFFFFPHFPLFFLFFLFYPSCIPFNIESVGQYGEKNYVNF